MGEKGTAFVVTPPTPAANLPLDRIMEYRKILHRQNGGVGLADFDEATKAFQAQYSFTDRSGKERQYANYSNMSVQQRADQLGEPWPSDYLLVYNLTSMHAHGAPGAILQTIFRRFYSDPDMREQDASTLMATITIKTMMRNVELLATRGIIIDATDARREYDSFVETLDAHASKTTKKPKQNSSVCPKNKLITIPATERVGAGGRSA